MENPKHFYKVVQEIIKNPEETSAMIESTRKSFDELINSTEEHMDLVNQVYWLMCQRVFLVTFYSILLLFEAHILITDNFNAYKKSGISFITALINSIFELDSYSPEISDFLTRVHFGLGFLLYLHIRQNY